MSTSNERRALLKDQVRQFAQGVIENLEVVWQDDFADCTDEEFALLCDEVQAISKRIGSTRTFVSSRETLNK